MKLIIPEFPDKASKDAFIAKCYHVAGHFTKLGDMLSIDNYEEATVEFLCSVHESKDLEDAMAYLVSFALVSGKVDVSVLQEALESKPESPFNEN